MENKKGKIALNDELMEKVSGGWDPNPVLCVDPEACPFGHPCENGQPCPQKLFEYHPDCQPFEPYEY